MATGHKEKASKFVFLSTLPHNSEGTEVFTYERSEFVNYNVLVKKGARLLIVNRSPQFS